MTSQQAFLLVVMLYIVIIFCLAFRLLHIIRRPERYEVIRGYKKYKASGFYWPRGLEPRKSDSPNFVIPTFAIPAFLWLTMFGLDGWMYQTSEFFASETELWCIPFHTAGFIPDLLYRIYPLILCFVLVANLTICSPLPWDICFTEHRMHYSKRSDLHKRWVLILLLVLLVGSIVHLHVLNRGGYVSDEEIRYTTCVPYEQHVYPFECINTEIIYDDTDDVVLHYYIVNGAGNQFDLCETDIRFTIVEPEIPLWLYVDELLKMNYS